MTYCEGVHAAHSRWCGGGAGAVRLYCHAESQEWRCGGVREDGGLLLPAWPVLVLLPCRESRVEVWGGT